MIDWEKYPAVKELFERILEHRQTCRYWKEGKPCFDCHLGCLTPIEDDLETVHMESPIETEPILREKTFNETDKMTFHSCDIGSGKWAKMKQHMKDFIDGLECDSYVIISLDRLNKEMKESKHTHDWEYAGERADGEFEGFETYTCKCGAMMFEGVLEPDE